MARLSSGGTTARKGTGGDRTWRAIAAPPDARRMQPARFRNGPDENQAAEKLPIS